MVRKYSELQDLVVHEVSAILGSVEDANFDQFAQRIVSARRVVCYGLGREELALRGFCMRLMHLSLDAHFAGDVTAKPIGPGDVIIVTSGLGHASLTQAMIRLGTKYGAFVMVVTARATSPDARAADFSLVIPAQTMANDRDSESVLAMGTAFEAAMGLVFDLTVIRIQERTGETFDAMRGRHFNLE